ncbi:MAG: HAMP domain-containing histidine kinase [Planctomycetes bacterium]|nr:HAMP domain-containing histidine kinase [Planctomycetota bacterium]
MSLKVHIILFVLGLAISEALFLSLVSSYSLSASTKSNLQLKQIIVSMEKTRELNIALTQILDPISDYVTGNTATSHERFKEAITKVEGELNSCASSSCHGLVEQPKQMIEKVQDHLSRIKENGKSVFAFSNPNTTDESNLIHRIENDAKVVIDMTGKMTGTLLERAKQLEKISGDVENNALKFILIVTIAFTIVAAVLSFPIASSITRPIKKLVKGTQRIASGDLNYRTDIEGQLEMTLLATSFNKMADDLNRHKQELLGYQHSLENEIKRKVDELQQKDKYLLQSERLASLGLIAAKVAHDLNNPLTSVLMNANYLLKSAKNDDKHFEAIKDIADSVQRCRAIVMELRSLARAHEGEKYLCDIKQAIGKAFDVMRFEIESRHISIVKNFPEGEVRCLCNPERITQLFVNLISNAIDATTNNGMVQVGIREDTNWIIIEVQDYGCGIPQVNREKLFKEFFTTKDGGVGLGLTICKHIVEGHSGVMEYETSTPEEASKLSRKPGTLVRILLPLQEGL